MTDSEKLDLLLDKVIVIEADVKELKQDVAVLKREMSEVKEDIAVLKQDVAELKQDVAELKQDVAVLKQDVAVLKQEVTVIKLTIDNELRVDIQRIAEGHLDLSRNLHEAIKPSAELEMLTIKVNMLEFEVKESKSRVS